MKEIVIPISIGELIDKITILEIKSILTDNQYVHKELNELNKIKSTIEQFNLEYEIKLKKINEKLWETEDKIREKEKRKEFDDEFIHLSREVYLTNDQRSALKKEINERYNSSYREVKLYGNK